MKEFFEKHSYFIVAMFWLVIIIFLMSGYGSTKQLNEKKLKKCCEKTVQAVYEYEGLIVK